MEKFRTYHINEGSFEIPDSWRDQSLNVFTSTSGIGLSLAISRDKIPWGMTFEEYALAEMGKIKDNFQDFEEDGKSVLEIEGARCPVIQFHWTSPQGKLFQMLTIIERDSGVVILTATMPESMSENQIEQVKKIFLTYKHRK